MGAAGDEKGGRLCALGEDRCDHRDVGQMVAPREGIVHDHHISDRPDREQIQQGLHAGRHGPEMGGDVRGLREHSPVAIKERARKIEPLLDVRRITGALQRDPHLFGHTGETMAVEFQRDWIHAQWVMLNGECSMVNG